MVESVEAEAVDLLDAKPFQARAEERLVYLPIVGTGVVSGEVASDDVHLMAEFD
jgi:hypothetical protein